MVHYIHFEHLGWWKKSRFVNFYLERVGNGVDFMEVIDAWNTFATRPEDTVYIVSKEVTELSRSSQCCGGNRGQCCGPKPDDTQEAESE